MWTGVLRRAANHVRSTALPLLPLTLNLLGPLLRSRKKSMFRAGARAPQFDDLAAAMDVLRQRVGSALAAVRKRNAELPGHGQKEPGGGGASCSQETGAREAPGLIAAVHAPQDGSGAGPAFEQQQQQQEQQQGVGTTEGKSGAAGAGADPPGWLQGLVQFSEYRQRHQKEGPASGSDTPPTADYDTITWLESGAGLRPQTGASTASSSGSMAAGGRATAGTPALGRSREDTSLLQAWLQDLLAQVVAQGLGGAADTAEAEAAAAVAAADADSCGADSASVGQQSAAAVELADAALWAYGLAFEELQRQLAADGGDRAALLGAMWQHVLSLVELRWAGQGEQLHTYARVTDLPCVLSHPAPHPTPYSSHQVLTGV